MTNAPKELIRLQELQFVSSEKQCDTADTSAEKERQKITQDFEQLGREVDAFFAKIFPKAIDVICSLNPLIRREGKILFFKNQEVQSAPLSYDTCQQVCKDILASFPNTVNALVSALKSRAGASRIEEISLKLCREFNTVCAFDANKEEMLGECVLHVSNKQKEVAAADYSDAFSEIINIPLGKQGDEEFAINLDTGSPDAHAVISGISGSGKSSLLQSLILGGAYKYSPEQLQFWILDFKDGTGFIYFKELKHVKVMCVNNRAIDSKEMMDYINKEYLRRSKLLRESGGDIRAYNQRAKANSLPLLPRLLIVIDEFVVMHRSCFSILNNIVVRGRALGMGFIFSSQVIETNAVYGSAIQQTRHLFEFANFDGVFGRLVKDVTEKEKEFVDYKLHGKGNCIYRNNSTRIPFRCAFAGEIYEQNEFIRKINEKWKDYPYTQPIIAGKPERKVKPLAACTCDAREIRERFEATKQVFVPVGESSTGDPYLYKIDNKNPLLLAFGDETRVAGIEYSVIEYFKQFSDAEKAVYYIDLNRYRDRQVNAVMAKYGSGTNDGVHYVSTEKGAKKAIDDIYKLMKSREKADTLGNPIELIIHNAEHIAEFKASAKIGPIKVAATPKPDIAQGTSLDDFLKSGTGNNSEPPQEDIGTVNKLSEILQNGKNVRIYVMLYFEEKDRFQNLTTDLFGHNCDFKDVIVVPKIPDEYEELSYTEVVDSLAACRLREQASMFCQTNEQSQSVCLEQSDFICAVLIDDKVPHKIIPYEWEE